MLHELYGVLCNMIHVSCCRPIISTYNVLEWRFLTVIYTFTHTCIFTQLCIIFMYTIVHYSGWLFWNSPFTIQKRQNKIKSQLNAV